MRYFLGVDSGATKAEFVLGDETRELVRVRTSTIKRMKADAETAQANLQSALRQLTAASGVSMRSITRCCIGTAGDAVPLVTDWLREAFARHVGGELILLGDVEIALDSAFQGGRGVLILAGTGSNVAGRDASGAIVTAGGWGPAIADQGSGHFIGLEGLRRGFLAIDRMEPTQLVDAVREYWQIGSLGELIAFANSSPAPEFSRLAPLVVACAENGDLVAQEVLEQAGVDLAILASLVIERISRNQAPATPRPTTAPAKGGLHKIDTLPAVAVAGSILEHVPSVRKAMEARLRKRYPNIQILDAPADPPSGALWNARHRQPCAAQPATELQTSSST